MPRGGPAGRFVGSDGEILLHLVPTDRYGQPKLLLVEDSTGLLADSGDARVTALGIFAGRLRGQGHYQAVGRAGDFRPGAELALLRERDNPHDRDAIGLAAKGSDRVIGYIGKAHAGRLAKRLDAGEKYRAISTTGTKGGRAAELVMHYLAAPAGLMAQMLSPRPDDADSPRFRPPYKS